MLVPGGQAEMREWTPETDRMVLITRHKGFVRMALKHGAALVPVISFQEEQILYNIQAKPMQVRSNRFDGSKQWEWGAVRSVGNDRGLPC